MDRHFSNLADEEECTRMSVFKYGKVKTDFQCVLLTWVQRKN